MTDGTTLATSNTEASIFESIGTNHQREIERVNKRNEEKARATRKGEHQKKGYKFKENEAYINHTKKLVKAQMRSQLESEALRDTIEGQEMAPEMPPQPYFLDAKYKGKQDESHIQVLNLELTNLPRDLDERELKHWYFKNAQIFNVDTEFDNLTGKCKGKSNLSLRVRDKFQSDQILQSLKTKGIKVAIKNQRVCKDFVPIGQHYQSRQADIEKKNNFLKDLQKHEDEIKTIQKLSNK